MGDVSRTSNEKHTKVANAYAEKKYIINKAASFFGDEDATNGPSFIREFDWLNYEGKKNHPYLFDFLERRASPCLSPAYARFKMMSPQHPCVEAKALRIRNGTLPTHVFFLGQTFPHLR